MLQCHPCTVQKHSTQSQPYTHMKHTFMTYYTSTQSKIIEKKLKSNRECHNIPQIQCWQERCQSLIGHCCVSWPPRAVILLWVSWPTQHPCGSRIKCTVIPHQAWWLHSRAARLCKTLDQGSHLCVLLVCSLWTVCQTSLAEYVTSTLREDDQGHLLGAGKIYW